MSSAGLNPKNTTVPYRRNTIHNVLQKKYAIGTARRIVCPGHATYHHVLTVLSEMTIEMGYPILIVS